MTMSEDWGFAVGEDELAETLGDIASAFRFIRTLGDRWREVRGKFYKSLPVDMVLMLDAAADLLRCETPGCLEIPTDQRHDFCDGCTTKAREMKRHLMVVKPSVKKAGGKEDGGAAS